MNMRREVDVGDGILSLIQWVIEPGEPDIHNLPDEEIERMAFHSRKVYYEGGPNGVIWARDWNKAIMGSHFVPHKQDVKELGIVS